MFDWCPIGFESRSWHVLTIYFVLSPSIYLKISIIEYSYIFKKDKLTVVAWRVLSPVRAHAPEEKRVAPFWFYGNASRRRSIATTYAAQSLAIGKDRLAPFFDIWPALLQRARIALSRSIKNGFPPSYVLVKTYKYIRRVAILGPPFSFNLVVE